MKKHDILITIKTYPEISKKHRETVCCAGILRSTKEMIRIYPIRYRYLGGNQQFKKYQWISAEIEKNNSDVRPESYRINPNTIELKNHINTNEDWLERCSWVLDSPHVFHSVEELQASREENGTSLGIIKPAEIMNFKIEKRSIDDFNALNNQKELIFKELDLFEDIKELDILPYRFYLEFRCSNPECSGHKMSILDWEFSQLYRNLQGQKNWEEKMQIKRTQICSPKNDTYIILGNMAKRHHIFCILGLFYPPKNRQISLF